MTIKKIVPFIVCLYVLLLLFGCNTTVKLGSVSGVVTLDSTPSSDITVSISGTSESTTTNSNGSYSLTGISAGNIILSFTKSGYSNGSTTITVIGGSDTTVPTVNLSSSLGSISGTARLVGQTDYSDILVEIVGASTSTTTDSLGKYTFSNLAAGSYALKFSKAGYDSTTVTADVTSGNVTTVSVINLSVSISTTTTTTTTTTISGGTVTGIVQKNNQGSAYAGINIAISRTQLSAISADDGSFTISSVPAGTYSLTISKTGYATRTVSNVVVQEGQATNIGINSIFVEYNMSYLSGDIKSMTQLNGFFYIATSQYLYKISQTNPTTAVIQQAVTHNYDSMMAGAFNFFSPNQNLIIAFCQEGTANVQAPMYTDSLGDAVYWDNAGTENLHAITYYNSSYFFLYDDRDGSKFIKCDVFGNGVATSNINEIGILSLEYVGGHFYACNSTSFYKYDYVDGTGFSFVTGATVEPLGGGTNLVGISHDGGHIYLLDAVTKKMLSILDN